MDTPAASSATLRTVALPVHQDRPPPCLPLVQLLIRITGKRRPAPPDLLRRREVILSRIYLSSANSSLVPFINHLAGLSTEDFQQGPTEQGKALLLSGTAQELDWDEHSVSSASRWSAPDEKMMLWLGTISADLDSPRRWCHGAQNRCFGSMGPTALGMLLAGGGGGIKQVKAP